MSIDLDKVLIDVILTKQNMDIVIEEGIRTSDVKGDFAPVFNFLLKHWNDPKFRCTLPTPEMVSRRFPEYEYKKTRETAAHICDEIRQRSLYNTLREAVADIGKAMKENRLEEVVGLLNIAAQRATLASTKDAGTVNLSKNTADRKDRYLSRKSGIGVFGIPTGNAWLDKHTLGYHPEDLILALAKRGAGKSWLTLMTASSAQHAGYVPMLISPEMSTNALQDRYDAFNAKIPYDAFRRGTLEPEHEAKYFKWLEKSKKLPPIHIPEFTFEKGITASGIHAKARSFGCNFIAFDGVYMMTDEERSSRWEKHYNICIETKMMLKAEKWPMFITNQLNKEDDPKEATLDNSAFGDSYGMFCSVGMKIVQGADEREADEMLMYLLKLREGRLPTHPHRISWDLTNMQFEGDGEEEAESSLPAGAPDPSTMKF